MDTKVKLSKLFRRSLQTAPSNSPTLGFAEIQHPFHPLRGKSFKVLKRRQVAGVPTLILHTPGSGTFAVAEEWTDWGWPYEAGRQPALLDAHLLLRMVDLIDHLCDTTGGGS